MNMAPKRVSHPVQVYLRPDQRQTLERLATRLDATKSDVLRRAIGALELQLADPEAHPALRLIGMAPTGWDPRRPDPAREHDRVRADGEESAWTPPKVRRRGR